MAQQDEADGPEPLPELPLAHLARVLSWLPLGERLACAPVSRAWRAAAAAATTSVSVAGIRQAKADSLSSWAAKYGEQLQELSATGAWPDHERATLALATSRLPGLRSLDLADIRLEERPSPDQQQQEPSSLAGLAQLERLRLFSCTLAWRGGLAGLSALTRLQSLHLGPLGGDGCSGAELPAALASAWLQLRALTSLRMVGGGRAAAAALAGLGSCSNLEELDLFACSLGRVSLSPSKQPGVFSDIAQLRRLTSLALRAGDFSIVAASAGASGTAAASEAPSLSSLQRLTLVGASLDPRALAELPQLQAISLELLMLMGSSAEQAAQQLFAQLGRQTQLVELELVNPLRVGQGRQMPAAAYSALTASSRLTRLHVEGLPMPPGAAARLFGPGHSLPQLRELLIDAFGDDLFEPGDLQRLVVAAPGLRQLSLDLRAGGSLQPVTRLTALTELSLRCEALDDDSAAALATLSQLQRLELLGASEQLSWRGVAQLTQLTGLTQLDVRGSDLLAETGALQLASTALEGQPPDVAFQLLAECCRRDPSLLAGALQQAAGERAALRAQLAERDAQLAERDAPLAERDRQLAESQAQLARAQAALAAAGLAP